MRLKSFLVLLLVTVVAVGVAAALVAQQRRPATIAGVGEPVLPGLLENANRIERIELKSGETTLNLARTDHDWVIETINGFPASFEKIKALVVGLAQLRRVEPKTEHPESYPQLGVEDAGPGAASSLVSLLDHQGAPVARLIVGKESFAGGTGGHYVRIPGEMRAWLAAGTLDVSLGARDWAMPEIVNIDGADVRQVRIRQPNGETIVASRTDASEASLTLRTVPAGTRPKDPGISDGFAGALTAVDLDDVKPAAEMEFPAADTTVARIETFDGLVIDLDLLDRNETIWIRLTASAADGASPETVAKATALADRTRGWAYQVSSWRISQLRRGLEDLVEPAKPS
ncbi:MAG: DUF4340 domain-containing protein [Rhodospirillales bacterium]